MERIITETTIQEFRAHLKSEEKSKNTVEKYLRDVQAFAAVQNGEPVTKEAVIGYKQKLLENGYAIRSVNSVLASLNSLFVFLGWHDCRVKALKVQRQVFCPEEKELSKAYPEIDLVTTPVGDLVGMVHCNNCTSDLNGWVNMFGEFAALLGVDVPKWKLYDMLYFASEEGERDCGGLLSYNYISNEHVTNVDHGRPLFVRKADSNFNLANFMRCHLYSAFGALKVGCDIMLKEEGVKLDRITGHGGLFKTERVGQRYLAAAINAPVTVMKTAGEGGAWGMAILANYMIEKRKEETLEAYLEERVFKGQEGVTLAPDPADVAGFEEFTSRYISGLPIVREAVHSMK